MAFSSRRRRWALAAGASLACFPLPSVAFADPSTADPATSDAAPPAAPAAPAAPAPAPPLAPEAAQGAPADDLAAAPLPEVALPTARALELQIYGDTQFQVLNRGPVKTTFAAAHADLFFTADVGKLTFLSEIFFEGREDNTISVDVERLQVSYLFGNSLRLRAGRSHTALGYYNDTFHHGNLFELTTDRPYGVGFEDNGGLLPAHNVGVGLDGTFEAGKAGAVRYDLEAGNGRLADTTGVAVTKAGQTEKLVNLRLRWLTPVDGLLVGINGVYDVIPGDDPGANGPGRPKVIEAVAGAHVVYLEHGVHFLTEANLIHHVRSGGGTFDTVGGFAELGYTVGRFTPYIRPEYIRFPDGGDPVFQDAGAHWAATTSVLDVRAGVRWLPLPQIAIKLEAQRYAPSTGPQEILTTKVAFGF